MELNKIHEWTEPREHWTGTIRPEDEWPFPTRFNKYIVSGEIAGKIRKALGEDDPNAAVILTEEITSGGYSEYTQEDEYEFKFECNGSSATFAGYNLINYQGTEINQNNDYYNQNFFDWLEGK